MSCLTRESAMIYWGAEIVGTELVDSQKAGTVFAWIILGCIRING